MQLKAMMHYRGESLSTVMTREGTPAIQDRLATNIAALQAQGGPEKAIGDQFAAFAAMPAPQNWQDVDTMEAAFTSLKQSASLSKSPEAEAATTAAQSLLFAAQERVFVPESAGKDFKLSLQFSQVVDPGYWQSLAPEDKNPQHQVPADKILWGWFRVSADLAGGMGVHVERMRDAKTEVDQDRAGVVARTLSELGFSTDAAGLNLAFSSGDSFVDAVNARSQAEGGIVEKMSADTIEQLATEHLAGDIANRPLPKDATAQKMLAGAKAVLERHQELSIEVEQSVSETASAALADVGVTGGAFAVMPEEGSKFTEWSPRKDWYAHLMGGDH